MSEGRDRCGWVLVMVLAAAVVRAEGPESSEPIPPEGAIPLGSEEKIVIDLDWPEEDDEATPGNEPEAPADTTPAVPEPPVANEPGTRAPAKNGLPTGNYLQLAFFESAESVARFKRQIAGQAWADDVRSWFDEQAAGHRILLGPLSQTDLPRLRQRLRAEGFDSFRYRAGP